MTSKMLYDKIKAVSEIPIIETDGIASKGLYWAKENKIYIKSTMKPIEKLKVLLHEYAHYVHLTYFYNGENRPEAEMIANGAAYLICQTYEMKHFDKFKDMEYSPNIKNIINNVANYILINLS